MEVLKNFLQRIGTLSDTEWQHLEEMAEINHVKTYENILEFQEQTHDEVFLLSGVVRAFLVDEAGNEKTTAFHLAGDFMAMHSTRTIQDRSIACYQAMTRTEIVLFKSSELKLFFSQNEMLRKIGQYLKEKEKQRLHLRDLTLLQQTALDKYKKFQTHYPRLEDKIAHKFIASYLGITPVSLSRIRKEIRYHDVNN